MLVTSDIVNKIVSTVSVLLLTLFLLYLSIFIVDVFYNIQKNNHQHDYLENKLARELTVTELCNVFSCSAIKEDTIKYMFDKSNIAYIINCRCTPIHIINEYYMDRVTLNLIILVDGRYVYLDLYKDLTKNMYILLITSPFIIFLMTYLIFSILQKEREDNIIKNASLEALTMNKSMIMITENIHHELNTPLEVIDNKLEKIHRVITEFLVDEYYNTRNLDMLPEDRVKRNRNLVSLDEDFEFIKTSSEQIYNILEKMKGFKHLRYSNGNKTIKNIVDSAFKMMTISNTNFEYRVDPTLSKYSINSSSFKNVDLLNVLINHFKNSIEANSNKIFVMLNRVNNTEMYLRIIDNGNGVPEKVQSKIFNENFTTKSENESTRGNGMYINKQLLKLSGGDIKLIESTDKGTTIEVMFKIKIRA